MFLGRFFRRRLFTLCGTDIDVYDQNSESVIGSSPKKSIESCIDDEILPIKRSRALTLETERGSLYSRRNSCASSDDEDQGVVQSVRMSIPTVTLGQITLSQIDILSERDEFYDPITLEPLTEPLFSYICSSGGKVIKYNVCSIVEFLLRTGDFRDPISRSALSEDDVLTLDAAVSSHNLGFPSLMEKFLDKTSFEKAENRKNTIRGLEACIGEVITDIMSNIETSSKNGTYQMSMLFSELDRPFTELKELSIEEAYQSLTSWVSFLKGPPKKPTKDVYGRLKYAVSYLENQWSSIDQEQLDAIRKLNGIESI